MANNSIKGFKVGNEVKKYDYNELDNLPENNPDDLAEEISDLKSDLADSVNDLNSALTQIDGLYVGQEITFEDDKYINVSGNNISNNNYFALTHPINVMEGATLTITTYTSENAGMMFFKLNGQKDRSVKLSNSTTNALVTATVVVPQGCASARITCVKSHKNDFKIVTSSVVEKIIDKFGTIEEEIEDADERFDAIQNAILRYSDTELGQANEWQNASITTSTGYPQSSTTRILSKCITRIKSFTANDGYKCRVFGFGRNYNYLGTWTGTAFKTNLGDYNFSSLDFKPLYTAGAVYFRIVILKTSGDTILTSDCVNVTFSFEEMLKTPIKIREPFTLGNYEVTDQLNAIHGNGYTCINVGIAETFYFRGQFSFPKNIHSASGQYQLIGLDDIAKIWFDKAVTTEKTVQPIEPVPTYNAGFRIGSIMGGEADVTLYPDGWRRDLLLGEDAMAFRFAGDCTVAGNQDIRLSVDADYITVYHSTDDSIIHKFTKSSYSTMRSLYEAMSNEVQSGDLTDFEIKWLNLDNLTPNDIIECDVALIGQYPTATEGVTRYDAFPFYFTTKQGNGKRYDVEVLIDQNNPTYNFQILINGYPIYKRKWTSYPIFKRNLPITIYDQSGNGITTHEIEIGVEPKSKYPTIANIFIEGIDIGLNATGIKSSSRHVLGLADYMAKLEREYITMDDIIRVFDGGLKTKSNYLWIMHLDDARHNYLNFATNAELRQELIAHGIYPSAAYMLNAGDMSAEEKKCMEATRKAGFDYHIHSAYTDGALNINLYSYDQLNANVTEAIEKFIDYFGAVPVVWGIHSGSLEYRISRYLKNKGFRFIFGGVSETDNALNEITRYGCKRVSALDSVAYSTYDRLYKSY